MSEKVLRFKEGYEFALLDVKGEIIKLNNCIPSPSQISIKKREGYYMALKKLKEKVVWLNERNKRKDKLVSVRLASESVDIKWLEKYVKHIRGCFEKNQPSDFEAGEETGRIEGLEVLLAEAKKEAKKK